MPHPEVRNDTAFAHEWLVLADEEEQGVENLGRELDRLAVAEQFVRGDVQPEGAKAVAGGCRRRGRVWGRLRVGHWAETLRY